MVPVNQDAEMLLKHIRVKPPILPPAALNQIPCWARSDGFRPCAPREIEDREVAGALAVMSQP